MSNHSPLPNDSVTRPGTEAESQRNSRPRRAMSALKEPLQFLGFWTAIALPFVHIPLLLQGLDGPHVTAAFLALLVANLFALYVGHDYNQS